MEYIVNSEQGYLFLDSGYFDFVEDLGSATFFENEYDAMSRAEDAGLDVDNIAFEALAGDLICLYL